MRDEFVITNARIVLADAVISGTVVIRDGVIAELSEGTATGLDFEGDFLIPGLIELHTDHLENHYEPRPGVRWNAVAALQAYDVQLAGSGITTVFDALRAGMVDESQMRAEDMLNLRQAIHIGVADKRLRAEHFIHLRCEVSSADCLASFLDFEDDPLLRLVSLMDHAPGQRQFATPAASRIHFMNNHNMTAAEYEAFAARRIQLSQTYASRFRTEIAGRALARGMTLASHDDATAAHVAESKALGVTVAEFPTTLDAAATSRRSGLAVLMGAPNAVRGASHSGNVSARELARRGLLDILSSDYIPFSLMQAPFELAAAIETMTLPHAIGLVTRGPAAALGLTDRGEIAAGKRADLVRVRLADGIPIVRTVWREGDRVL